MLPRRFNSYGSRLDTELRIFLLFVIAKALNRPPQSLPLMTDTQLWQSFQLAATKINPYADIPSALTQPLNPGDFFAIEAGRELNTSTYPEGREFDEISNNAIATAEEQAKTLEDEILLEIRLSALLIGAIPKILKSIAHPQTNTFNLFAQTDKPKLSNQEFVIFCETAIHELLERNKSNSYPNSGT